MSSTTTSSGKKKRNKKPTGLLHRMKPRGISNNEFVFRTLWVLAASFVGWFLLFVPGQAGDDFIGVTYPTTMRWMITLITVFMIVGVAFDWIIYRGRKASAIVLPAGLLAVLTVFTLLLSGPLIQFLGDLGQNAEGTGSVAEGLWSVKVGGVLALLFNGWLVWRIWGLGDKDSQLTNQEDAVERLTVAFAAAETDYTKADADLSDQRDIEAKAKKALDDAEDAEKVADKALPVAQEKFDKAHKPAIALLEQAIKDAKDVRKAHRELLANHEKNVKLRTSDRAKYDADLQDFTSNVLTADSDVKLAELALEAARKVAETTPEGVELKDAKDKLEAARASFIEAQNTYTGAQAATEITKATFERTKTAKAKRDKELKGAREGLIAHQRRATTAFQGWWFGTIVLLVSTWVLYSSWYGWVLTEFG